MDGIVKQKLSSQTSKTALTKPPSRVRQDKENGVSEKSLSQELTTKAVVSSNPARVPMASSSDNSSGNDINKGMM